MKIFGFEINWKRYSKDRVIIRTVAPSTTPPSKIPTVKIKTLSYAQQYAQGRGVFIGAEYDLSEIGKIEDVESYVRQAFKKKEGLMFKEGVGVKGPNKDTIRYYKTRMAQIARASNIPEISLLKRTARSLIRTSNAFLVKVRDLKASGGRIRTTADGKLLKPIAAYFPAAPETMRADLDENTGKIRKWRQLLPDGRYKDYVPEDVIHFVIDRREGFLYGIPSLIPAIDDIRALRQIEENIEQLLYQNIFPLFHYKVGTETAPAGYAEDGTREVDAVEQQVRLMPSEGALVTPERHEIKAIGSEGRALRAEGYLEHFKRRVFTGLGVSEVDMGISDTSNRSTAQVQSRALVDSVKCIQDDLEAQWNFHVISELLLESTFGDHVLEEDSMVYLRFAEIDIQNKMDMEEHATKLWKENGLTYDEYRAELNREPIPLPDDPNDQDMKKYPEWAQTHWKLIREIENLIRAVDEPYCYDNYTELLTNHGWKFFKDLDKTDQVAVLLDGEKLSFEYPKSYIEYDYDGWMYYLDTRFVNLKVTPNHRLYIGKEYRKGNSGKENITFHYDFSLVRADEAIGRYKKFKRSAIWTGEEPSHFYLSPATKRISPSKEIKLPEKSIPIEDWLKILGWYISEGYLTKKHNKNSSIVNICQDIISHPEYFYSIKELLSKYFEIRYLKKSGTKEYSGICFADKQVYNFIEKNIPDYAKNKRVPSFIKTLSPRLIQIFLKTLMLGDGEIAYHYVYSTISKDLADDVQELCLYAGWAASIRVENRQELENAQPIYRIGIHKDKYIDVADRSNYHELAKSSTEQFVPYKGKIYCVETKAGILFTRREGHVCWCGNSVPSQAAAEARSSALTQKALATAQQAKEKEQKVAAEESRKAKLTVSQTGSQSKKDHFLESSYRDFESDASARLRMSITSRGVVDRDYLMSLGHLWANDTISKFHTLAMSEFLRGFNNQTGNLSSEAEVLVNISRNVLYDRVHFYIYKLVENTIDLICNRVDERLGDVKLSEVQADAIRELHIVFDVFRYRTNFIWNVELRKAYSFGYVTGMRFLDQYGIELQAHPDSCEKCKAMDGRLVLANLATIDDVPPFHPNSRMSFRVIREYPNNKEGQ